MIWLPPTLLCLGIVVILGALIADEIVFRVRRGRGRS